MLKDLLLINLCSYARSAYSMLYMPLSFRLIILTCLDSIGIVWGPAQGILALSSEEEDRQKVRSRSGQVKVKGLRPKLYCYCCCCCWSTNSHFLLQLPALLLPLIRSRTFRASILFMWYRDRAGGVGVLCKVVPSMPSWQCERPASVVSKGALKEHNGNWLMLY